MYNVPTITTSLAPVVGFRQQYDTKLDPLSSDLLASSSGLLFQDAHALVTLDNIAAIMPLDTEVIFADWDALNAYKQGAVVTDSNRLYFALKDVPISTLLTNTDYWQPTNFTSYWLRDKRNASIRQVVPAILQAQQLAANAKTLLENNNLFEGTGNLSEQETNMGRFVGFEIRLVSEQNIVDYITRIITQFNFADPSVSFNLYLYHSSSQDAVKVIPVTLTKPLSAEVQQLTEPITIGYQTGAMESGGTWYLGYYEADVDGNAINKQYDFLSGPCNNCLGQETASAAYKKRSKYASIIPFAVSSSYINPDKKLWDIRRNVPYNNKTWGLNFTQTFKCDFTDFIVQQSYLFARAIQLQFAVDMLREMAYSTRTNRVQEKTQQKAMFELDNRENGTKGLAAQLTDEIASVSFNMSSLSPICQPAPVVRGVRYRGI